MQAAYQRAASKKRPRCKIHQGRINYPGCHAAQLYLTRLDGRSKAATATSAADLDRAIVPAGARVHAPLHRVAIAIVVIGIVVGVVRIAVVVSVIIGVEAVASKPATAVKAVMETTVAESATGHRSTVESATAKS